MKAVIYSQYGSPEVLQVAEVPKPTPKDDQALIRLYAASVNPLDCYFMRGKPFLLRLGALRIPKHKILGADIAGTVEAVGNSVRMFKPGDEVFGGGVGIGGFAEYACAAQNSLALKPMNLTFENAAAVPVAAITALQGLRDKGRIRPGQNVLIDGASGGVGTFAIQIAKWFGAEVTAVCSPRNLNRARSLGADHVIDYTRDDFTEGGQRYDLIFAANAYHSIFDYRRSLARRGTYAMPGGGWAQIFEAMLLGPILSLLGSNKMGFFAANINTVDLDFLSGLLETGKVVPVIDRHYPLDGVADAVRYLEQGHAQGKVVISIEHSD